MEKEPKIPKDIVEMIKLSDSKKKTYDLRLLYDGHQYSLKIPAKLSSALELKASDKFEIHVESSDNLTIKIIRG